MNKGANYLGQEMDAVSKGFGSGNGRFREVENNGNKVMKVLIADDEIATRLTLEVFARSLGHDVITAENGDEAYALWKKERPRLVVLDWVMPGLDGLELCNRIRDGEGEDYTYIIVISGQGDNQAVIQAMEAGADDYMPKPFRKEELFLRLKAGERVVNLQSKDLVIFVLAKLAESRDSETGFHLERIRHYSKILAETMAAFPKNPFEIDRQFIDNIFLTSPLHDIGKVGIPDRILLKPGPLTPEEFEIMKRHTLIGHETLMDALRQHPKAGYLKMSADIALCHHEHFDGRGYPLGVAGEDIPLSARIVAVADVYDAMVSKRVYRKEAFDHRSTAGLIVQEAGSHFDPLVTRAFQLCQDRFMGIRKQFDENKSEVTTRWNDRLEDYSNPCGH